MSKYFWQTVGLGTLAGMRSMSAPALLSANLKQFRPPGLAHSPLRFLQKGWAATGFKLMAAGEMIVDKLPQTPNRTAPTILLGRILSGALVGATLYKANRASLLGGALLGSSVAVAATFGSYWLRKTAAEESGLPIALVGGLEDALVISSGLALTKGTDVGAPQGRDL